MHGRHRKGEHRGGFHEERRFGADGGDGRNGADTGYRGRRADRAAAAGHGEQVLLLQPLDDLRGALGRVGAPESVHVLGDGGRLQARPGIEQLDDRLLERAFEHGVILLFHLCWVNCMAPTALSSS